MAEPTPIPPPESESTPLSPVTRASSFPHKTSASTAPVRAYIETNTPAINDVAVELDGAAIEPPKHKHTQGGEGEGGKHTVEKVKDLAGALIGKRKSKGEEGDGEGGGIGLGEEEDINEEFLGREGSGVGREIREKRAALLSSRSRDPGVIVDVPKDPTAEEVQAARSAEGTVTPAVVDGEAEAVR